MLLPHVSIKIVKGLEIALIHHGQIGPKLDHLGGLVDKHISLHRLTLVPSPSDRCPKVRLVLLLIFLLLPVSPDHVFAEGIHELLTIEYPFKCP